VVKESKKLINRW